MQRPASVRPFALVWAPLLVLAGCGDAAPPVEDAAPVSVSFVTVAGAPVSRGLPGTTDFAGSLAVEGTNGTLVLEELHLVVDRLHLATAAGTCRGSNGGAAVDTGAGDARGRCPGLGAGPVLVDLPVDAVPVRALDGFLPPDRYVHLQVRTTGLGETGRSGAEAGTASLPTRVRDAFPGWPDQAAIRLAGSFAPADGTGPRPFVTYLRADASVGLDLAPPVNLTAGDRPRGLVVTIDPRAWFAPVDGVVPDLSTRDSSSTRQIPDLGARAGDAFIRAGPGG